MTTPTFCHRLSSVDIAAAEHSTARDLPRWYARYKMGADVVLAAILLVLTGPIILLLLALVRLTSRGPALYSQRRAGLDDQPFRIIKIRTMYHDCERSTGPKWATADDPRVTPLGRVLRRCHLDELPQLWNVLCGEMSLVGPRPERPEIIKQLELAVPRYRERHQVRPGITGLAQILLPADEDLAGVGRKVRYDLCYIRRMGPWLDVRILAGTVLKVAGVPACWRRRLLGLPGPGEPTEGPRGEVGGAAPCLQTI